MKPNVASERFYGAVFLAVISVVLQGASCEVVKPKVKAVLDEQRTKMGELRNETDQEVRRTKGQALRTETTAKMKEILTAEQFTKWEKMAQGMRGNRPPGGAPGGAGGDHPAPPAGDKPPQK